MSEYVVEMKVKQLRPRREERSYPDYDILAEFNLRADSQAFQVYQKAFAELVMPRATVTIDVHDEMEDHR